MSEWMSASKDGIRKSAGFDAVMAKTRADLARPSEVPIYCCGQRAVAFWNAVQEKWTCGRCGAPIKVAW